MNASAGGGVGWSARVGGSPRLASGRVGREVGRQGHTAAGPGRQLQETAGSVRVAGGNGSRLGTGTCR